MKNTFTFMGVTKKCRELYYQLTRKDLMTVFEDILDLIQLKVRRILVIQADTLETHAVLREELVRTTDIERINESFELFVEENEKNHDRLAFKDPDTGKTKWDMWQASTFHDEYVKTKNGYMRYWFVCMAGGNERPCMTAILSKKWQRKFEDPSTPKNKYKCTVCNETYMRRWGVFVEVQIQDKLYVLRSTVPDEDTLDIKAMDLEREHKDKSIAQALYDAIPMIAPTVTQYMSCHDKEKGQYKLVSKEAYMELPQWNWTQVLTFTNE
jgi:hypothetical protein